jgi:hypothetical protein
MLNKIINTIAVFLFITQFTPLFSQEKDSLTTKWLLVWQYGAVDSIASFEIYRNTSPNKPTETIATVRKGESDFENKSWRDFTISPKLHYYYWVRAKNDKGVLSDYSDSTNAAVPIVKKTMDTIKINSDTTIYLDIFVEDDKYSPSLYKDSLAWEINGKDSEIFDDLTVSISKNNIAEFNIVDSTFQTKEVDFKVYDIHHVFMLYINKTVIKYVASYTPPDTSEPSPPDSSIGYDPTKETIVYPIPYRASVNNTITFDNLPPEGELLIFDVMGGIVFNKEGLTDKQYIWNVKNKSGRNISPGLYIFKVRDTRGNEIDSGKVVIIR